MSEDDHPTKAQIPEHIAIIMDGNGRWARRRGLPRTAGHAAGVDSTRKVVELCARRGVRALTLFAFSSENWKRPAGEVDRLMELFLITLRREARRLGENNIRLRLIGERSALPLRLQEEILEAEQITREADGMNLVVAANYGGRWDIAQAAQRVAEKVLAGKLAPQDISPDTLAGELSLADLSEPDLFIRTGGEQRISNFLLWQLAYTELYFTETFWPDFDATDLDQAIASFAARQRRFGLTGEQVDDQA